MNKSMTIYDLSLNPQPLNPLKGTFERADIYLLHAATSLLWRGWGWSKSPLGDLGVLHSSFIHFLNKKIL